MATLALAVLMLLCTVLFSVISYAEDTICGDGEQTGNEQCDDGNTTNRDGCSASCAIELCGNATTDPSEQCDDGNTTSGDGCSSACALEFCGNEIVDRARGEQCDDGNQSADDGCSPTCDREPRAVGEEDGTEEQEPPSQDPVLPAPPVSKTPVINTLLDILRSDASDVQEFLSSTDAADVLSLLGTGDVQNIGDILDALAKGQRLTDEQRSRADELVGTLSTVKETLRTNVTDLLSTFIASPISALFLENSDLHPTSLTDADIARVIETLSHSYPGDTDASEATTTIVDGLQSLGIDLGDSIPSIDGQRPLQAFAVIKDLKERAEKQASDDPASSITSINDAALAFQEVLPSLGDGEDIDAVRSALSDVARIAAEKASASDHADIVKAVSRLANALEKAQIMTKEELQTLATGGNHAAADSERIDRVLGIVDDGKDAAPAPDRLQALIEEAPEAEKAAFSTGTVDDQKESLTLFLENDPRVAELREQLAASGDHSLDQEFQELSTMIGAIGEGKETPSSCDDSVASALACSDSYLQKLQTAARNRTFFTRVIGTLQDSFAIAE